MGVYKIVRIALAEKSFTMTKVDTTEQIILQKKMKTVHVITSASYSKYFMFTRIVINFLTIFGVQSAVIMQIWLTF